MPNAKGSLPPLTESQVKAVEMDIMDTFYRGGSHSHNIIQIQLTKLSKTNRAEADRIYSELREQGW